MKRRRAFLTGCTGQDGSYLTELLLEKDYEVFGLIRRSSTPSIERIAHVADRVKWIHGDMMDQASLDRAILQSKPHEVYNLAAQSHVGVSFSSPITTVDINAMGAMRLFESVRQLTSLSEHVRIYQASSSEMFGNNEGVFQDEHTPFHPVSPYGISKLTAHTLARVYRESYGLDIRCGIAFNHESERRGEEFVTRKITKAIARIKAGQQDLLHLGNTSAMRDWLHAEDVVKAMWLIMEQAHHDDFIIASGQTHSVREFVDLAFNYASLDPTKYVNISPTLLRPTDIQHLKGNAGKARRLLGWKPEVSFSTLVKRMVEHDLEHVDRQHRDSVAQPT